MRTHFFVASFGKSRASALRRVPEAARPDSLNPWTMSNVEPQYAWRELSSPRDASAKGERADYYRHPRRELLALLRHRPRNVLDVGCGGGATGALLQEMFTDAVVAGIESNEAAATAASTRLDRVFQANVEEFDFEANGFAKASIDVALFPDVLEHLYDPWHLLERMKPLLSNDAQVIASIPNVRNLSLIGELARGNWDYVEEGLLDVTHIRFFTRKSVDELFQQTGYRIHRYSANVDNDIPARLHGGWLPGRKRIAIDSGNITIRGLTRPELDELRTVQFLVDAEPV
jgi:trans-aconitate methyltransferase